MRQEDKEKQGKTEAIFRDVNERIAYNAESLGQRRPEFLCECSDPNCTERVEATLEEYEEVRADATTFLLAPGHEAREIERVIADRGRYEIVEKMDRLVRAVVRRRNPRPA